MGRLPKENPLHSTVFNLHLNSKGKNGTWFFPWKLNMHPLFLLTKCLSFTKTLVSMLCLSGHFWTTAVVRLRSIFGGGHFWESSAHVQWPARCLRAHRAHRIRNLRTAQNSAFFPSKQKRATYETTYDDEMSHEASKIKKDVSGFIMAFNKYRLWNP